LRIVDGAHNVSVLHLGSNSSVVAHTVNSRTTTKASLLSSGLWLFKNCDVFGKEFYLGMLNADILQRHVTDIEKHAIIGARKAHLQESLSQRNIRAIPVRVR